MKMSLVNLSARIVPIVFVLGIIISPLVVWPWFFVPYEIPRIWFIQRWVELLVVLGIIASPKLIKQKNIDVFLVFLLIIFTGTAVFSSLLGVDLWKSLLGNYYRGDGLVTLFHLIGLTLFIALFWKHNWFKATIYAISLGSFLTSVIALFMSFLLLVKGDTSIPHWENGTVGATFGNPHFLAGFLVITLPFIILAITLANNKIRRLFWTLVLITQFLTIITTRSWGGIFGVILFLIGWLILQRKRLYWIFIFFLIGITGILGFFYLRQTKDLGFVAESRERIIRRIILGVSKRPILGWGWANSDYAFEAVSWPIPLTHDVYVDKAHSMLLEVLATTGIVGLTIYVAILGRVGKLLFHRLQKKNENILWTKTLILVFLLYVFHSQTNIISIGEELIFWLIVGIISSETIN